jgi:hypothetical protein
VNNETQSEYVTARVPVAVKQELERRAAHERRSVSQVILMLLESALGLSKDGKKATK